MINPFKEIQWQPNEKELKSFSKAMFIGFSCVALLLFLISGFVLTWVSKSLLILGFLIFICGFVEKSLVKIFYYPIFFISACIGIIVSNLILILFYYFIFTPIALCVRVFLNKDSLNLKKNPERITNWQVTKKRTSLKDYLKQY